MKNRSRVSQPVPGSSKSGFALIASLSIMAVLLMIGVALYSMSTSATRSAAIAAARIHAQQNALLGATIALGDLQRYAGPDQRITGRGETLVIATGNTNEALDPETDARAFWTGVARSDGDSDTATTPAFEETAGNRVQWLISGYVPATGNLPADPSGRVTIYPQGSFEHVVVDGSGNETTVVSPAIEAGWVSLDSGTNTSSRGRFAFFVEDEGVKSKLRTLAPSNGAPDLEAGSIVPGNAAIDALTDWESFSGDAEQTQRLLSMGDLELLNVDANLLGARRMDHTLSSYGVLSNNRLGGLRWDLSTAFEDDTAFDALFAEGNRIVMDQGKLDLVPAPELRPSAEDGNDYIHWNIFRDYYGLKDVVNAAGVVDASYLKLNDRVRRPEYREGYGGNFSGPLGNGPHGFKRYDRNMHSIYPETDIRTDNPLKPILAYFYFDVWADVERLPPDEEGPDEFKATLYFRPWLAYYNPYNVRLQAEVLMFKLDLNPTLRIRDQHGTNLMPGDRGGDGSHVVHLFKQGIGGWDDAHFVSENKSHRFEPGEIKVMTMNTVVEGTQGLTIMTEDFEGVVTAGFEREVKGNVPPGFDWGGPIDAEIITYRVGPFTGNAGLHNEGRPYFITARGRVGVGHGNLNTSRPYQWMIFPLDYDRVRVMTNSIDYPGKRIVIEDISIDAADPGINANNPARFGMWLRTSGEKVDQIRPLIDSNLRATFINPRWDVDARDLGKNGLGIPTAAAYTGAPWKLDSKDQIDPDLPKGGNLWGIYDADVDAPTAQGQFPTFGITGDGMRGNWGSSHHDLASNGRVILFDVPRQPLVSLGQLQHAEAGHFSYEPSYVVANSYANIRIPLDDWRNRVSDTFSRPEDTFARIPGEFNLYDASYLVNEVLWDDYIFTSIPFDQPDQPEGDTYAKLLARETFLPNPRFVPYQPQNFSFDRTTLGKSGENGVQRNAGLVLADGAFNVNSTSVNAWEAFLSSTTGLPLARLKDDGSLNEGAPWQPEGARFPRLSSSLGGEGDFWDGFETLDAVQIRELAVAIVEEIRSRGPFRTLGEFVNRWNPDNEEIPDNDPRRKSGALQAALDRTVNAGIAGSNQSASADNSEFANIPEDASQAAGFPGHILQGDLLQAFSPNMSVRSDTFKIRSVGQVLDPTTNEVTAEVWYEMVVQRLPDPVAGGTGTIEEELIFPSSEFGRRFLIVNFRRIGKDAL